jgi:hypothetical protein
VFPNGHLPDTFDPADGIRSLFPIHKSARVSDLVNYLYSQTGMVQTAHLSAAVNVSADGAGNWCLRARVLNLDYGEFGVGFVFGFSTDAAGHGYVATGDFGDELDDNVETFGVFANGFDTWITENWTDVFSRPSFVYMSEATGNDELPPIVNTALDNGFAGLTSLQGEKPGDAWMPSAVVDPNEPSFEYLWGSEMLQSPQPPPPHG